MNAPPSSRIAIDAVEARLAGVFERYAVRLTIGGEPTFVPRSPEGDEWHHAAVGPTKHAFSEAMTRQLRATAMPEATVFFAPGKCYPGELNPRWAIWLVQDRSGKSIMPPGGDAGAASPSAVATLRRDLVSRLGVDDDWRQFYDPADVATGSAGSGNLSEVWALLLDHADCGWTAHSWPAAASLLTTAAGPAGLRLPLDLLPEEIPQRAVVLERRGDRLAIFLPPLLQEPFIELLTHLAAAVRGAGIGAVDWQGAIPPDDAGRWTTLGLTADPGVLEVNLPACHSWREYDFWLRVVSDAAAACGLRSWRQPARGLPEESGGGSHLLWGGPTPADTRSFPALDGSRRSYGIGSSIPRSRICLAGNTSARTRRRRGPTSRGRVRTISNGPGPLLNSCRREKITARRLLLPCGFSRPTWPPTAIALKSASTSFGSAEDRRARPG